MIKIGVLADTHVSRGLHTIIGNKKYSDIDAICEALRGILVGPFNGVAAVLHAGDITDGRVLDMLKIIAPVHAVAGNMDIEISGLQRKIVVEFMNFKIGMFHGRGEEDVFERAEREFGREKPHCIVFGHTHLPYNMLKGGTLYFNPGSVFCAQSGTRPSVGILSLDEKITGEHIYLDI